MLNEHTMKDDKGNIIQSKTDYFTDSMTDEGYRIPYHKLGARIFSEVRFPPGITHNEIGKMTLLSKVMVGDSNALGYRSHGDIIYYTPQEIGELVRLKRSKAFRFVNRMCQFRVLQQVTTKSDTAYYINPAYFMASGKRLNLNLYLLFQDDLKDIIPQWAKAEFTKQAQVKQSPPGIVNEAEWLLRQSLEGINEN